MITSTQVVIAGVLFFIFSAAEYFLTRRAGWLGLVLPLVVTAMGILLEKVMLFLLIPLIVFYIIAYGLMNGCKVYEVFVKGAKDGVKTVVGILPTLVALMTAVGILRASGFFDIVQKVFTPVSDLLGFPSELFPLVFMKMFSSSAATGLVLDIFKNYGTDSYIGMITSIMMSCTETIFYTMSVYFIAAKVTKTRYTLAGAMLSTVVGIIASVILAGMIV